VRQTAKVEIAKRTIHGIRPWAKIDTAKSEWQVADGLLKDAHVIFGCLDGYRQRMYLNSAARRYCLPHIDIGMDVTRLANGRFAVAGQMIVTLPNGPCMRCLGFLTQDRLNREEDDYGSAGINPQVVWTNGTLASLAVGTFVRLVTPWFEVNSTFEWLELDGDRQLVQQSRQPEFNIRGPCQHFTSRDIGDPFFELPVSRADNP
jgi:hypothetical protein